MTIQQAREILNIPKDYDETILKKALKKLAKDYHPDANMNIDEETRKLWEQKMKDITEAYHLLLEDLKKEDEEHKFQKKKYKMNQEDTSNDFINHILFDWIMHGEYEKYTEYKEFFKSWYSEEFFVKTCIYTDLAFMEYLSRYYTTGCLMRRENPGYFPVVVNAINNMIIEIKNLIRIETYTYDLLTKLDSMAIDFINNLYSTYRIRKFDKEKSYGYECLISLYDEQWNENKKKIYELAIDCNYSWMISKFISIFVIVEEKLDSMKEQEKREFQSNLWKLINKSLMLFPEDEDIQRKRINLEMEIPNKLNFFDDLFNAAYFYDSYVNKNDLKAKKKEVENFVYTQLDEILKEIKENEDKKTHLLTKIDCFLDKSLSLAEYFPEEEMDTSYGDNNIKEKLKKERTNIFRKLILECFPNITNTEFEELVAYIQFPDFHPTFNLSSYLACNSISFFSKVPSLENSLFIAKCFDEFIIIDSKSMEILYKNSVIKLEFNGFLSQNKKHNLRFFDKKYNKLDFFYALRIVKLEFSNGVCRNNANFVRIDKNLFERYLNELINNFKKSELREPTEIEQYKISYIAMSMVYTNYSLEENKYNNISQQKLNELRQKLGEFMNKVQWKNYAEQLLYQYGINVYQTILDTEEIYLSPYFRTMLGQEYNSFGTLYFDNRSFTLTLNNDKKINSLNEQRRQELFNNEEPSFMYKKLKKN